MPMSNQPVFRLNAFAGVFSSLLKKGFRFLSSVKLAIPVLLALIGILAAGTIIESLHGAEAGKILVYDTWWFTLVLILLGTNVFCATLTRLPWQKKHTGFVLTHFGMLLILAGSFVTRHVMIDSQMALEEGESGSVVALPNLLVQMLTLGGAESLYEVPRKALPWQGREALKPQGGASEPFEVSLRSFYPKARSEELTVGAETGPAALKFSLHNLFVNETQWLTEAPSPGSVLRLGPLTVVFAEKLLAENTAPPPPRGYLELHLPGGGTAELPVPQGEFPQTDPIEGTPYKVTFLQFLKDARVEGLTLKDLGAEAPEENPAAWGNPALRVQVEGPELSETHTVFSNFPDFPTIHGRQPGPSDLRAAYQLPQAARGGEGKILRFVKNPEGGLFYQLKDGLRVKTAKLAPGENVNTGWMDLVFRVEKYLPHSKRERRIEAQSNLSLAEDVSAAIEVEITDASGAKRFWLRQGIYEIVNIGGQHYHAVLGQKVHPLGFSIELKDFRIEHNPGTSQPASFSSDVVLHDPERGIEREVTISMNEPLEHRGYKIYQSAYKIVEGQPEISVFSVARDPGIPLKYGGSLVMIAGIVTMFSMRRFRAARLEPPKV